MKLQSHSCTLIVNSKAHIVWTNIAWQIKNFHHKDLIATTFQNIISPSSPPICSWSFGKSEPPTNPTATFWRSSFMNSFISGVTTYDRVIYRGKFTTCCKMTSQIVLPWSPKNSGEFNSPIWQESQFHQHQTNTKYPYNHWPLPSFFSWSKLDRPGRIWPRALGDTSTNTPPNITNQRVAFFRQG